MALTMMLVAECYQIVPAVVERIEIHVMHFQSIVGPTYHAHPQVPLDNMALRSLPLLRVPGLHPGFGHSVFPVWIPLSTYSQ